MAFPTPVPARGQTAAVFDSAVAAFLAYLPTFEANEVALQADVTAKQAAAAASETNATAAAAAAAASATAAAAGASAQAWASGTTYTIGQVVFSPISLLSYRRKTNGAGTTDPSADPTNWQPLNSFGLTDSVVTGTTQTAVAGMRYLLSNVATTTVTAPTAADGAEFEVVPVNGLFTNTVDFGAGMVIGPAGSASGVITLNLGASFRVKYFSTLTKWVML